jgi:hypothetical protein
VGGYMGQEIDLLVNYPKTQRDVKERGAEKSEEDRAIARTFGKVKDEENNHNVKILKRICL